MKVKDCEERKGRKLELTVQRWNSRHGSNVTIDDFRKSETKNGRNLPGR